jgi:hypothetical protein
MIPSALPKLAAAHRMNVYPTPEEIQLWHHYEEIAMHFNSLLMQYRLQFLGGAGTLGAIASYLIGGKIEDAAQRHWLRFLVSTGLLLLMVGAAVLDIFYYNRLLRGAVNELLRFEGLHPTIQMSTQIERTVGWGQYAFVAMYIILITVLGGFVLWSWKNRHLGQGLTAQAVEQPHSQ